MRNEFFARAALAIVLACGVALATPVPLGGSATFVKTEGVEFVPPMGDLVDSETRTLDLTYTAPAGKIFGAAEQTTTTSR